MPEHEFELYLSLLSRFLRLKPAQRDELADELRDHLEERLEALAVRGLSREEAIRTALDEFGDAAELAHHFTHLAHVRKRRLIMRFTFGTDAALAASLLVATAFWPETHNSPTPQRAIAQFGGGGGLFGQSGPASITADGDEKSAIEAKLSKRIGVKEPIRFEDLALSDVLEFFSNEMLVDILVDWIAVAENDVTPDRPVNLKIAHTTLTARVALDLVLEPLKLSYTTRDGYIMVTTAGHANQILVYNVKDLLQSAPVAGAEAAGPQAARPGMSGGSKGGPMSAMMGGPGAMAAGPAPKRHVITRQGGGFIGGGPIDPAGGAGAPAEGAVGGGMGGGGGGFFGGAPTAVIRETDSLADLIAATIDPESWDEAGGPGSIVQYRELLVVKNSQTVHGKIKVLLEMLRTSAAAGAPVPAGKAPPAHTN
jgi:hypothetical protein